MASQNRALKQGPEQSSMVAQRQQTQLVSTKDAGLIPGLTQWVRDLVLLQSCGVGLRWGLDPMGLWRRLAAVALPGNFQMPHMRL